MPIKQEDLHSLIEKSFPDAKIKIVDLAGDDDHYSVEIIDASFAGKSRVQQHKMVNKSLDGLLDKTLHAMQLKTKASE